MQYERHLASGLLFAMDRTEHGAVRLCIPATWDGVTLMSPSVALFLTTEERARWRGRNVPFVVDLHAYGGAVHSWAAGQPWDRCSQGATAICEDIAVDIYAHIQRDAETLARGERDALDGLPDIGDDPLQDGEALDHLLATIAAGAVTLPKDRPLPPEYVVPE